MGSVKWQCQQIAGGASAFKGQASLAWGQLHQPCCCWSLKVLMPQDAPVPWLIPQYLAGGGRKGAHKPLSNQQFLTDCKRGPAESGITGSTFLSSNTLWARKSRVASTPLPLPHSQPVCWSGCLSSVILTQSWGKPAAWKLHGLVS